MTLFPPRWPTAALLVALALFAVSCDTYYTPPPPVGITVTAANSTVDIISLDSSGNPYQTSVALEFNVTNSTNLGVNWYVGQLGNYFPGGNPQLGFVSPGGVYTAPTVLPIPNQVTIKGEPQADTSQSATTTITLLNPPAVITSVTPSVVTAGHQYTLDVVGNYFSPDAAVALTEAQVSAPQFISSTEIKVPVQINLNASGILQVNINNVDAITNSNAGQVRAQPATPASSSAIAVELAQVGTDSHGNPMLANKAYVPRPDSLAVVNLDANKQFRSVALPSGFQPSAVAANPFLNEVVTISATSPTLIEIDANLDSVLQSYPIPLSGSPVQFNGQSCMVCGLIVDSARDIAILATNSGYLTMDLSSGAVLAQYAVAPAPNFAYDPNTQRVYAPFSAGSANGLNVIDLLSGQIQSVQPSGTASFGTHTIGASFDPTTNLALVTDLNSAQMLSLNFNSGTLTSAGIAVPAGSVSITNGCSGSWFSSTLEPNTHFGWFANNGSCLAVAVLQASPGTGTPGGPSKIAWAPIAPGPDGLTWNNTTLGLPPATSIYTGSDDFDYGLAVRQDSALLLKMQLPEMLQASPPLNPVDANQVDPTTVTTNSGTVISAITYISLH